MVPRDGNARGVGTAGAKDNRTDTIVARPGGAASVAAARAPFLTAALRQSGRLGTPEARDLAQAMLSGIDVLEPEAFYRLSTRMEALYTCSPEAKAEARERSDRWAREEAERRRGADLAALGVGARAREYQTWL